MNYGSLRRGGKNALMSVQDEQWLIEHGCPVRCCDYWPECSHVLSWYEQASALRIDSAEEATPTKGTGTSSS